MHPYIVPGILAGLGTVIVILSAVLGFAVVPNIIDKKIEEEVRLIDGGETWDKWKEIPIPVYLNFYMLNVTNPDDFEAGKALPVFVEKGPYSYRQTRVKVNITQEDGDETVSFEEQKTYFYDKSTSCDGCEETDEFNIVNLPFVAVVTAIAQMLGPSFAGLIANARLGSEKVIRRNVKVGELAFYGFDVSQYMFLEDELGVPLPEEFEGGKFALYKTTNGSTDGVYKIYTGVGNSADFGKIISWEGRETVPDEWWKVGSPCAMINGTDGSIFPPFVEKSRRLDIFVTDLCRSLYLLYDSEVEHLGIKGYRFTAPKAMLEDPRINGDNMCFCMKDSVNDCPYGGVLSVSTCRGGAPISMSTPYFLDGDYKYNKESGLAPPVREKHYTYIDLEINTGVTLGASKKIQVNIDLRKINSVIAMKNLASDFMIFPLLWADEKATLDEESANDLKKQLLTPLKIVNVAKWAVMAAGCLLVGIGIGFFIMRRRQSLQTV